MKNMFVRMICIALAMVALAFATTAPAQAEKTVIHVFTGAADGSNPNSLVISPSGRIFGTSFGGGNPKCKFGCGVVFELFQNADGHWTGRALYSFTGGADGGNPVGIILGNDGVIYGLTMQGGAGSTLGPTGSGDCNPFGCGVAYRLAPEAGGGWKFSVLYRFKGFDDGAWPLGTLVADAAGNLFGTTSVKGAFGGGTAFELSPNYAGPWKETVIHAFETATGSFPETGLTSDSAGNLYGTASGGSLGNGVVFRLSPNSEGWIETVIHNFTGANGDGSYPRGKLWIDAADNIYGDTFWGGTGNNQACVNGCGVAFKLTQSGDNWDETIVHEFTNGEDGGNPEGGVIMDQAGNLWGTAIGGGSGVHGVVFRLSPDSSGGWAESAIESFANETAGNSPRNGVIIDSSGNIYGTTNLGGKTNRGTAFKLSSPID